MNGPNEKSFKQLWRDLSKAGWNARKPKGLSVDFTYVKPGVSGRLDESRRAIDYFVGENELMAFARQSGLLELPIVSPPRKRLAASPARAPVAAPVVNRDPNESSSVPTTIRVAAPAVDAGVVSVMAPEAQVEVVSTSADNRADTEQVDGRPAIPEDTELVNTGDLGSGGDVDAFDSDQFIDAMRAETLFEPVSPDDVNVTKEPLLDDEDADDDDALIAATHEHNDYGSDIESDSDYEGESHLFQQDDDAMRQLGLSSWKVFDQDHSDELALDGADDLYDCDYGPTKSAAAFAASPLGMFFYFLPKALWIHITKETNDYRVQCIPSIAEKTRDRQLEAQAKDPTRRVMPLTDIVAKLQKMKPIKVHEIVHVIGLLVARTLCGHTDGLNMHWATQEDGAVPRGTFGRYMKRGRFKAITRYLHFASNNDASAQTDKAWKVRPVLQTIEKTFRRGYRMGARVSFDEGTIPNRSQFNPIRVYNKDKPHKVEVYLGAEKDKQRAKGVAQKAVIRNIGKALDGQPGKRLVIADNFYSSCALALQLLSMGYYFVGTHRNDRLGWPTTLSFTQKSRPAAMPRGTYRIAQAIEHPSLVGVSWMDSKPVNMIATGCATTRTVVVRKDKRSGVLTNVPCPQLVADYHAGMGGVDSHDQLRLQSYSIQQCVSFKKYYKQLFLAFVDMAVVNGFILHKLVQKKKGEPVPTHAEYMRRLQVELLGVTAATFRANMNAEDLASVPLPTREHILENNDRLYHGKRRQHLCKVCSALSPPKTKGLETSYFCEACCVAFDGYVPLCNRVRREETGNTLTCSQIWHTTWVNGTLIPPHLKKRIRFRKRRRGDASDTDEEDSS